MRTSTPSPLNARALRISDFCRIYSLGRSSTYVLIKEGKLASVVIAGRRLIPVDAAEALLSRSEK